MTRAALAVVAFVGLAASACATASPGGMPADLLLAAGPPVAAEGPAAAGEPGPVAADAAAAPARDRWTYSVAPFLWFPSLDTRMEVKGHTVSSSLGFQDLVPNLDLAVMAHLEARRGPWGIFAIGSFTDLSSEETSPLLGKTTISMQQSIGEGAVAYRFLDRPLRSGEGPDFRETLALDAYAGARYTKFETKVNPEPTGSYTDSMDWLDGIVGLRARMDLSPRFSLFALGDGGGFQGDDDSSWFFMGGLEWRPSKSTSVRFSYAVLKQKYADGDDPSDLHASIKMSGPILGLALNF